MFAIVKVPPLRLLIGAEKMVALLARFITVTAPDEREMLTASNMASSPV